MEEISKSTLGTLNREELKAKLPVILTYDGEPTAIVAPIDGVIVVSDLHPRVRNMLKAQEKRARFGMPEK